MFLPPKFFSPVLHLLSLALCNSRLKYFLCRQFWLAVFPAWRLYLVYHLSCYPPKKPARRNGTGLIAIGWSVYPSSQVLESVAGTISALDSKIYKRVRICTYYHQKKSQLSPAIWGCAVFILLHYKHSTSFWEKSGKKCRLFALPPLCRIVSNDFLKKS